MLLENVVFLHYWRFQINAFLIRRLSMLVGRPPLPIHVLCMKAR
jgi:hypothetical protein